MWRGPAGPSNLTRENEMAAYIVRRLVWVIFLLFVVTLITFIVFTVLPAADPAVLRAGRQPSPELVASIREQFGLSDPKIVQFFRYVGDILPFVGGDGVNFGYSFQSNQAVLPQILDRMPATIFLTGGAVVLWLAIGIPIGMISAVKTGSLLDRASMGIALDLHLGAGLLLRPRRAVPVRRQHRRASRSCPAAAPTRTPPPSSARRRR